MPSLAQNRDAAREALASRYGSFREDKPAELFAAILRAFLERSMDRDKAMRLLAAFRDSGLLDPEEMKNADPLTITETATSDGIVISRQAVGPIKKLARWAMKRHEGIEEVATETLRNELLAFNGIGRATADAILLRALDRPVFPVDRASYRVFVRHGWLDPSADEEEARDVLERLDPDDVRGLTLWSDWLERVGAEFCRPSIPKCERCPLRPFLPENGPIDPSGG